MTLKSLSKVPATRALPAKIKLHSTDDLNSDSKTVSPEALFTNRLLLYRLIKYPPSTTATNKSRTSSSYRSVEMG